MRGRDNRDRDERFFQDQHHGIFSGMAGADALSRLKKAEVEVDDDGTVMAQAICDSCGAANAVGIEAAELIAFRYGLPPQIAYQGVPQALRSPSAWAYDPAQSAWFPGGAPCGRCRAEFRLYITADEGETYLRTLKRRGLLTPQAEAQLSQIAASVAQRARGGM